MIVSQRAGKRYRSRRCVTVDRPGEGKITRYALNEAFLADQHPAITSRSVFQVDGGEEEEFYNLGIVISSGTGSTGWLKSARYKSVDEVKQLFKHVEDDGGGMGMAKKAKEYSTQKFNKNISFDPDSNLMFYYIR